MALPARDFRQSITFTGAPCVSLPVDMLTRAEDGREGRRLLQGEVRTLRDSVPSANLTSSTSLPA